MQARRNESGFSTLVALTTVACLTAVAIAFTQTMTVTSKAHRDAASNSEINSFHMRLQKLLSTEWSCTLSLRGSNYNDPISLVDPVSPGTVIAEDGTATGPFWTLAAIRLNNVRAVDGRQGVFSGELNLTFRKSMVHQVGAPIVDRVIHDVWFEASPEGYVSRCYPNPVAQSVASAACKSLGGSWNGELAFGSQCTNAHGNPHDPDPAPTATPTSTPTPAPTVVAGNDPGQPGEAPPVAIPAGLCFDSNAGIVALPNSQMSVVGNGSATTGVYLLNGARLSLSGNAAVDGELFEGNGATHSANGNATVAHVTSGDLTSLNTELAAFAAAVTALTASSQLSKIDDSMTLTANGRTVIQITGDVTLTGNRNLTLSGSATDSFVINVVGKITVSGNAQILLAGGITAKNVVFNNIGLGNEMVLSGNGSISGTFLAIQRGVQVSGNGHLTGAVVAGGGVNTKITISGNGLAMTPQPFCTSANVAGNH